MGILETGDLVALITSAGADDMVVDAIRRALDERGVKAQIWPEYELAGVSRQDALALMKARQTYTSENGFMEEVSWIERQFPDAAAATKWLKDRRGDI
jgi:hypothetical protein